MYAWTKKPVQAAFWHEQARIPACRHENLPPLAKRKAS
jgi:hypothetical protein